ncbi:MAG: GDSL family lipase [Planctomycetes bacterium]|jgi:lysophospholipase L1-like esterase|nr:GDSL family lipase [Planctomycetota bacterium]MCP4839240.1 GDSL family lipase [Planctomycetota bacterium]
MPLTLNLILAGALCAGSAVEPTPRDGWHAERHEAINAKVASAKGQVDVVFVGDSITQGWERAGADVWNQHFADRKAINLGISGDRTEHVLWRLDNGNMEAITPKVAVVMIGTNNIGHGGQSTADVLAGVQRVVNRIGEISPTTQVLLLDIFPRGFQFNEARGRITQINQALARLHDDDKVVFLPIGQVFVEDDGSISPEIMPDALHLSAEGYQRWADAIEPTLRRMLARDNERSGVAS